jgi:hypothetical protein
MTLAEKVTALKRAGFPIRYADKTSERCPDEINWSDLNDSPWSHHTEYVRYYVDLSSVAKGEDYYDQSTTMQRSNYKRLREDYPDVFTDTSWSNVNGLGAYVGNLPDEVTQILTALQEQYPVYDESDMSELEDSEIQTQWDDFAAYELGQCLAEEFQDTWNELSNDEQRRLFAAACEATGYYPEHNGIEVLWSYAYQRTIEFITVRLAQR